MPWHQLRSHLPVTSLTVGFRSVLRVVNSIVVAVTIHSFFFDLHAKFPVEIHSAKTGLLRCCLYTSRRLQQTIASKASKAVLGTKVLLVPRLNALRGACGIVVLGEMSKDAVESENELYPD